jgi:HEPN domain-containing protein
MSDPEERVEATGEWLRLAELDVRAAELLMQDPEQTMAVCFHSQQAVEKALKACLVWLGLETIPRTHNLEDLLDLLPTEKDTSTIAEAVAEVSDYAIAPRYPGARPLYQADAIAALEAARSVLRFAREMTKG